MTDDSAAANAPSDLGALIEHISQIPDQLADAWARALDADTVQRGITQLERRVSSFASAYAGEVARREAALTEPTKLSEIPLADESLNFLPHPDTQIHWGNAESAALWSLAQAMRWLREPSRVVLNLPEATEETLWDTGIFVEFRDQLALLSRVHVSRPAADGPDEHPSAWIQLLKCAHRAHAAGLPEAVCLYLRLAFRGVEEALALASRGDQAMGESPSPTRLKGEAPTKDGMPLVGEDFVGVRNAIGLLVETVNAWGRGETVDLATTVLLADGLLRRVDEAVSRRLFAMRPPPPETQPAHPNEQAADRETSRDDG